MHSIKRIILPLLMLLLLCSCAGRAASNDEFATAREQLVAHAGGAIYGYRYTNSLEAFNAAYDAGFKYFEADLCLTDDGETALIHDWEAMAERMTGITGRRSMAELMSGETFAELTIMDGDMLTKWLRDHDECYIITDCKDDNATTVEGLFELAPELKDRYIIQIYSFDEYDTIKALGAEKIILTLYRMSEIDIQELIEFNNDHPLWALTINIDRLDEDMLIKLNKAGISVYAHTVNELSRVEDYFQLGLTGIYTDYFTPAKWVN